MFPLLHTGCPMSLNFPFAFALLLTEWNLNGPLRRQGPLKLALNWKRGTKHLRGKKVAGCGFVIDGGIKLCQLERGGTHRPTHQLAKVTWGYKIVPALFQDTPAPHKTMDQLHILYHIQIYQASIQYANVICFDLPKIDLSLTWKVTDGDCVLNSQELLKASSCEL